MPSITKIVALAAAGAMPADAFVAPQQASFGVAKPLFSDPKNVADSVERGVSIDQDGKSNVWAIEPKMEVDTKSSEEKTTSTLVAAGGAAAFIALAAGVLLNLPDPDQF